MFLAGIYLADSVSNGPLFSKQIFSKTAGRHHLTSQVARTVTARRIFHFQTVQVATTAENNTGFVLGKTALGRDLRLWEWSVVESVPSGEGVQIPRRRGRGRREARTHPQLRLASDWCHPQSRYLCKLRCNIKTASTMDEHKMQMDLRLVVSITLCYQHNGHMVTL